MGSFLTAGTNDYLPAETFSRNPAIMLLAEEEDGRIIVANNKFYEILKVDEDELKGKSTLDLGMWIDSEKRKIFIKELHDNGHSENILSILPDKNDNPVSMLWSGKLIDDGDHKIILKSGLDVTTQIERQKRFNQRQRRYREVVENMAHGILELDLEGTIVFNNSAAESMLGYEAGGLLGRPIFKLISDAKKSQQIRGLINTLQEEAPDCVTATFARKDSTPLRFRVDWHYKKDDQSRVAGLIAVLTGMSEQVAILRALEESEQRFKDIAMQFPETIYETDRDARVVFANKAAFEKFGYEQDVIETSDLNALDLIAPQDRAMAKENIAKVIQGQELGMQEYNFQRQDGGIFPALVHSNPIVKEDSIVGLRGFVFDISKRKRNEQKIREAKEILEEKVTERTRKLEEANIALKILLENREVEKKSMQENLASNIGQVIRPMLERLKVSGLNSKQRNIVSLLEGMIGQIVLPYARKLANNALNLTPTEIEVATLLKQGLSNKEVAETLNVSYNAVAFHRQNIRKKLGLKRKKVNLITHLQNME